MKVENVPHKTRKVTNPEKGHEKGSIPDEKPGANRTMTRSQWIKQEEKANAAGETSSMLQSKHPACQVKMQKSYVLSKSDLNIPASFIRKHMKVKGKILKPSFPEVSPLSIGASKKSITIINVVMTSGCA